MTETTQDEDSELPANPPPVEGGVEREIFGKWKVLLINLGGILSVLVVCLTALINSFTIYLSVTTNGKWPSEMSMFIMMVGPVICAWGWMNVNGTLKTIMSQSGFSNKMRTKVAEIIAPKPKTE